ncbi:MAG: cobalt-precorrin-6A reductase [Alphaproteobacteria bacterium]
MTPASPKQRVLILGGTAQAVALAAELTARFGTEVDIISSQAGRTRHPREPAGTLRIGGFGGVTGLAAYLVDQQIDMVIDATHPFAQQISANARAACHRVDCPRLILARPPWRRRTGDDWRGVDNAAAAAAMVASLGSRVFLTLGHRDLPAFAGLTDHWFLIRVIEQPHDLAISRHLIVTGRGPFDLAAERTLMHDHRIDVLVTKASGGAATAAKLIAAREAGLPVVMIRRPLSEPGEQVDSLAAACLWVSRTLGLEALL